MSTCLQTDVPSYEAVLDGLRHVCHRQVVRYRHDARFAALAGMGFITWVRQPIRLSQQPVSARSIPYRAPVEVAELTATGRSALDWLRDLAQSPQWHMLKSLPYGHRPPGTS